MQGPDTYDLDDSLMDELGGAMDDYDGKTSQPTVSITINTGHGQGCECQECKPVAEGADGIEPSAEELDELLKSNA